MRLRRLSLAGWWREPREAGRLLLRRPLWALLAAGTLAVGMAAVAAAVAVGDALFLAALPGIARPDELVRVSLPDGVSYPELRELASGTRTLRDLAGFADQLVTVDSPGSRDRSLAVLASEAYFPVLGVRMERGRPWSAAEAAAATPVLVIGHDYWQRRLGGDPAVVGRVLRVQGMPATIVGVAPPGFVGTFRGFGFDLWMPLAAAPRVAPALDLEDPALRRFELVARLAPGASRAAAGAELRTFVRRLRPAGDARRAEVLPLTGFDEEVRRPALALVAVLLALATLVLLVTLGNVGGVLLARGLARRRELAVRSALGASRWQVTRLLFWETLFVTGGGALLGALGAAAGGRALVAALPPLPVRIALDLAPGARATFALLGLAALTALVLATLTARGARDRSPAGVLRAGRGGAGGGRLRAALLVGQVAAASALLLLAGSFLSVLRGADRGSALAPVLAAPFLDRASLHLDAAAARALLRDVEARVAAHPGVRAAALADRPPLPGGARVEVAPSELAERGAAGIDAHVARVTESYFPTLGISWRQGHWVEERAAGGEEAVLDRTLAQRLWPGEPALGRRFRAGDDVLTVAGVVEDLPGPTGDPRPTVYRALLRDPPVRFALLVRAGEGEAGRLATVLRADLERAAPGLGPADLTPLRELRGVALLPQRLAAAAGSVLGATAILVAAVGLYALLALVIAQGRRDMAVRAALGARPRALVGSVLGRALVLVGSGYALGAGMVVAAQAALPGAPGAGGTPVSLLAVAGVLAFTTAAAGALPALRAWRVDPAQALREE